MMQKDASKNFIVQFCKYVLVNYILCMYITYIITSNYLQVSNILNLNNIFQKFPATLLLLCVYCRDTFMHKEITLCLLSMLHTYVYILILLLLHMCTNSIESLALLFLPSIGVSISHSDCLHHGHCSECESRHLHVKHVICLQVITD